MSFLQKTQITVDITAEQQVYFTGLRKAFENEILHETCVFYKRLLRMFVQQIRSLFELCYDHRRARANRTTTCPRNECSHNVLHLQTHTITDKTVAHRQSNISSGVRTYALN